MDPEEARLQLNIFIDNLPDSVFLPLRDKDADPSLLTTSIASAHGFVIRETGHIVEGVLRVLKGELSPANYLAFIQQDKNIETDNRSELFELAFEIQTKVFDVALPPLKAAGFRVQEGRVPEPSVQPTTDNRQPTTETSTFTPSQSPPRAGGEAGMPSLEEKNVRALLRIAVGTNYTEGELRDAFESLPEGLRHAVASVDTANAVQTIVKKYLLHVDQMAALASETGLVLLGLTHPADFIQNLAHRLRLPEEKAKEIARDISAEVLVKVRDALRELHDNVKSQLTTDNRQPTTETTTPHPSLDTSSRAELATGQGRRGGAVSAPLPKMTTPFSPGTQWAPEGQRVAYGAGTDDTRGNALTRGAGQDQNILRQQANMKETRYRAEPISGASRIAPPVPPSALRKEAVGPTGWKPMMSSPAVKEAPQREAERTTEQPLKAAPFDKGDKTRPSEHAPSAEPAAPRVDESANFLEEKLQQPMHAPKEEKSYSMDPYREPLDS